MDRVNFTAVPEDGTIVHLEKFLEFDESHPVRRGLLEAEAEAGGS